MGSISPVDYMNVVVSDMMVHKTNKTDFCLILGTYLVQ